MKKLLLIRHAKAANETSAGDFIRPLKHSGTKDAQELAERLQTSALIPQIVYTSPALRAKTTAQVITDHLKLAPAGHIEAIYEASDRTLLTIINDLPDEYSFVALTGHNPGLSMIATYLSANYCSLATCAAVLIEFEAGSWAEISNAKGKISWQSEP